MERKLEYIINEEFHTKTIEQFLKAQGFPHQAIIQLKKTKEGIDIRMYLDSEKCEILRTYGFWYDKDEKIIHFKYNGGIQHITPEQIGPRLDQQEKDTPAYLFKEICLHEQYFYEEFFLYQNNYFEKLDTSAKWCKEHGYEPTFMDEIFEFDR